MRSFAVRACLGTVLPGVLVVASGCSTAGWVSENRPVVTVPIRDRYAQARIDLLRAINEDRSSTGRALVTLDSLATVVAQSHAEAMSAHGFFSHYGPAGDAPYERLAEAGGTAHVLENVFQWRERGSSPRRMGDPWGRFDVRQAEAWLMASPGHRETILDPHRTSVGLGMAVDAGRGEVVIVQDFIARHVDIDVPPRAWRRSPTGISGRVLATGLRPILIVLRRELRPRPWQVTGDRPPGGSYDDGTGRAMLLPPWAIAWRPSDRSFTATLPLGRGSESGRYYGIVYVAPERNVERALGRGSVATEDGWPGAAFVIDLL